MNVSGHKVILSLCDYSGVWSNPYLEANYDVRRFDLAFGQDVRLLQWVDFGSPVYGILAAPPCDHFASSGARWWKEKGESNLIDGLSIVDACLRAVAIYRPEFWVLENPVGRLSRYLGPSVFSFDPCDYGDPYTKRTHLWGKFVPPLPMFSTMSRSPVAATRGSAIHRMSSSQKRKRSMTPAGFARAFFEANP